ncbi:hypothetical protein Patl1_15725 [Pistacia atlantica]|uniref:Uncharacterized protein n=1 Tax=Pistacia atlantica TaxID=434234 RepID=A0ACC1B5R8_9ROSI|nr:hypothetical protein Patl1_15725 [Pistacia atlantica]
MLQELENPYILIHDKKILDMNSLVRILELALNSSHSFLLLLFDQKQKNRELFIVSADVESDALATFILNKHHAGVKVIFEDHGLTLDKVKVEMLGTTRKVTVSVDDTIILHGGGDMKLIEERCGEYAGGCLCSLC